MLFRSAQIKIWAGYSGASARTSGGRNFRPPGRNFRPTKKMQKEQNDNGHIFRIRTPFSMILGSLDSQRKALKEHREKHHCTSYEEEITRREFDLTKKDTPENLQHQKRTGIYMKSVFDELELAMEMNIRSKLSHG